MNREDNVEIVVGIKEIGPIMSFDRKGKPSFVKRNVTLQTMTDKLIFAEVRKMKILEKPGIEEGAVVTATISFSGSQKGEKKYNNIFINNLELKS